MGFLAIVGRLLTWGIGQNVEECLLRKIKYAQISVPFYWPRKCDRAESVNEGGAKSTEESFLPSHSYRRAIRTRDMFWRIGEAGIGP